MVGFFARGHSDGRRPRALILVENAPVPEDRRVTAEAQSLLANGYDVSVICPTTGDQPLREYLDGVLVARYRPHQPPSPPAARASRWPSTSWRWPRPCGS